MKIHSSGLGPGFEKVVESAIAELQPVADSGIALAVIKDGALCFAGGFGLRDRSAGKEVNAETCFAVGSATKAFTSMAISMQVAEGKLAFDVPIRQYLPDFKMKDPQAAAEATLKDALCHRTGLPRHDALWYLNPFNRSELFYRLPYLDPIPGAFRKTFIYNNLVYMVAGNLLENLFGTSWEAVIKARILDPLGMAASSLSLADLVGQPDYAKGYEKAAEIPLKNFNNIGPAAEINSTVLDMAKWIRLFLDRGVAPGGKAIISEAALQAMYTALIGVGNGVSYGLGWFVGATEGKRLIFHDGDADGNSAYVSFMPDDGLGVIALSNQHCTPDLVGVWPDKVVARIYEYLLEGKVAGRLSLPPRLAPVGAAVATDPVPAAAPGAPAPGGYTGMFSHPAYGDISVSPAGSHLRINYYNSSWPLEQLSATSFYFALQAFGANRKVPVTFHLDGSGTVDALAIPLEPTVAPIQFVKR